MEDQHTFDQPEPAQDEQVFAPPPVNGRSTTKAVKAAAEAKATKFAPVSLKAANAAKKGTTSSSRTGKGKQASFEFNTPSGAARDMYFKSHPSPAYHTFNLPVYYDEGHETFHYIDPVLFECGDLPDRFQRSIKLMDIHTIGVADGSFFLWKIYVTDSKWRKSALKVLESAKSDFVVVQTFKARQTYFIDPATDPIPEPRWEKLPAFESMLLDAFDSSVNVADDKVVTDFMSGGVAIAEDRESEGDE
jgi:hypothetical protein